VANNIINITSGKGGVGKTTITVEVARDLARKGKRVLIFDGDLELSNVNLCFGKQVEKTLVDFVTGSCSLREIISEVADGIHLIPSGSGKKELIDLDSRQINGMKNALNIIKGKYDFVLIDSATGIGSRVMNFIERESRLVLVINDDILSITDSFSMIKRIYLDKKAKRIEIITNKMSNQRSKAVYLKIAGVVSRFMPDVEMYLLGNIERTEKSGINLNVNLNVANISEKLINNNGMGESKVKYGNNRSTIKLQRK